MPPFRKTHREAYANFLRAKYEAYSGASRVRSLPFYLCVEPSDVCQLRCTTCPTGRENESRRSGGPLTLQRRNRAVMKPELFDALLDELGPYLFLVMFYNWGEPLLNKGLPGLIRKARDFGIETELHSNLSLPLSEQRIDELLSSGLDSLNGSIDGFSQEAYQIHRVGGDVELVKRNLEALAAARTRLGVDTRISYKMLIFRHNEHEIPLAERFCRDLGIDFIRDEAGIQDPSWLPSYRKNEEPYFYEEHPRETSAEADVAGQEAAPGEMERTAFWAPHRKKDERRMPGFCSWHYGVSVVTAGGPVSPCCATPQEEDDFGTFEPGVSPFGQLWNNERYRHARGVLAGGDNVGSDGIQTLCDDCRFSKIVQHVYSMHDLKVVAAFHQRFGEGEHALNAGFRLLSRLRYGRVIGAMLRRGFYHPLMLLRPGRGDEREMAPFVQYYESHLADGPTALDPPA